MKKTTLFLVAALATVIWQSPAFASCIMDERSMEQKIAEAEIVFVGTVLSTSNGGRNAEFKVEEVWKGNGIKEVETVYGGAQGNAASSVDRQYTKGTRYLVFPYDADGSLNDNSCSPTTEYSPDHAQYRPAGATGPEPGKANRPAPRVPDSEGAPPSGGPNSDVAPPPDDLVAQRLEGETVIATIAENQMASDQKASGSRGKVFLPAVIVALITLGLGGLLLRQQRMQVKTKPNE